VSNFVDECSLNVKGGNGGAGCVSFRREAHTPKGGPDGGDGGSGGDVWLVADHNTASLLAFRDHPHRKAQSGTHGKGAKRHGSKGDDMIVHVPVGTQVFDWEGTPLADLVGDGDRWLAAAGGIGGKGNARFLSNKRRAPGFAEQGEEGEERWIRLELKLMADVALVGFPNVGKSTLINYLAGRAALKVQDRPGVTRAPQWLSASPALELLDSPGLLWPRLGDPAAARRLAYIAAVRDEVLDTYRLSLDLLEELMKLPGNRVRERFRLGGEELRGQALLEAICVSRGFLLRGGEPDLERGAACVLDEFRSGLLGRVTLETPGEAPDAGS